MWCEMEFCLLVKSNVCSEASSSYLKLRKKSFHYPLDIGRVEAGPVAYLFVSEDLHNYSSLLIGGSYFHVPFRGYFGLPSVPLV